MRQVLGMQFMIYDRMSMFQHRAREFNVAAESVFNKVLDEIADITVLEYIDSLIIQERFMGITLWSDWASRGNPGESSAAACVRAVLCLTGNEKVTPQLYRPFFGPV